MRRALYVASIVAVLGGLLWLRQAIACCWDSGPSVRFNRVHAHSPLRGAELEALATDDGWFLDADLVRAAYAKEEARDLAGALEIYRGMEKDAGRALQYRRQEPFLLKPLDIARTRVRIASALKEDALPFLTARRAFERGHLADAKALLREGGPLAEEWLCLAGELGSTKDTKDTKDAKSGKDDERTKEKKDAKDGRDGKDAVRIFARGNSLRANWLLSRAQREAGDVDAALTTLEELRKRDDLGTLADDVLAEIGRCHVLRGDMTQAARDYEALLAQYPDEDMRQAAEESLLYVVYPALKKAGMANEIPAGVADYLDGLGNLLACGLAWSEYPDSAKAPFEAAFAKGPAWLRPNALYRTAMCSEPKVAARKLRTLLRESPEGEFAPLAHYLLALREGGRAPHQEYGAVLGPCLQEEGYEGSRDREWEHLQAVTTRFPASQWAPAALLVQLAEADARGREDEGIAAAASVFRAQPAGGDMPYFARTAMGWVRKWVEKGEVSEKDLAKAGFLDRYLLETNQPRELIARCPDSPFALRALIEVLNEAEESGDETASTHENDWCMRWQARSSKVEKDETEADDAKDGPKPMTREVLLAATRVLERAQGGNPLTLASAHVQVARARLALGDAPGARANADAALKTMPDGACAFRAWDARGRADLALGRIEDAQEAAKQMMSCPGADEDARMSIRAEIAVAMERAGDRLGALRTYCEIGYKLDAEFLAEVVCTTDEVAAYCKDNPKDYEMASLLWRRFVADGRWREARRLSAAGSVRLDVVERLMEAWSQVEVSRNSDPEAAREAESKVRELGDDDWATREAAMKRIVEIGTPAAAALKKGLESDDAERRARCKALLEQIPSDPAVALYRWATAWFELGQQVDGDFGGDIRRLRYVTNFLSADEEKAVQAFLERQHGLFRSRKAYQEIADRYPQDPTAAKALYMVGVVNLRLYDLSGWYGVVGSQESLAKAAHDAFLDLVQRFPKSSLADDGLFWASYFSSDPREQKALRQRIVKEYPDEDVMKELFPTGDWEHAPSEERLSAFRAHNKALRQQGGGR